MRGVAVILGLALLSPVPAVAQLTSQVVVSGLSSPVAFIQDPTLTGTQYVVQQGGRIRAIRNFQIQTNDVNVSNSGPEGYDIPAGNPFIGQGAFEEIDYEPANTPGRNYAWCIREGFQTHSSCSSRSAKCAPLTGPIHTYRHSVGQTVIGGRSRLRGGRLTCQRRPGRAIRPASRRSMFTRSRWAGAPRSLWACRQSAGRVPTWEPCSARGSRRAVTRSP